MITYVRRVRHTDVPEWALWKWFTGWVLIFVTFAMVIAGLSFADTMGYTDCPAGYVCEVTR